MTPTKTPTSSESKLEQDIKLMSKKNNVDVEFSIDKETGRVRIKVDGPNPEVEKEVGLAVVDLLQASTEILYPGMKLKINSMGYDTQNENK